jgi:microcystin-dependent protein
MPTPYLGEVKLVSFAFPPKGWALCDGQLLSINQNQALFSLLGTTYGGDGRVSFGLPDLRGRVPMHNGEGSPGTRAGEVAHTLSPNELPVHSHTMLASSIPSHSADPAGRVLGATEANGINVMQKADGTAQLHPNALTYSGGNNPHNNLQPYLSANFIIALQGIFPSRD